jgi:hypothetical protein
MSLMALCCAVWGPALAQQQSAPPTATPAAPAGPPAAAPAAPPAAAPAAPSVKAAHPTAQSEAGDPRADTSNEPATAPTPSAAPTTPTAAGAPAARASAGPKSAPRTDRLNLDTATVTGDREQPKVMYVVPWKRSDIGDQAGKPMNSLVDEILAPVDRDVFKREVVYYHAVQADTSQNGAPPKPAQQGEK